MWPVLDSDQIARLQEYEHSKQSATSTISNNESRTMRSAETQTELLECSGDEGASSEDAGSCLEDEPEASIPGPSEALESQEETSNDEEDESDLATPDDTKLKNIKRLNCGNLFHFNRLELLNERCSVTGTNQQNSDSSRNLCEHEMHLAIDEELEAPIAIGSTGEGKRTNKEDSKNSSIIFIQESPEVIL